MIRASDRVSSVLAQDPNLIEVFVQASPAFEKLRNAAMRKTMARLVTVEQAARIAGIDAARLLEHLNVALANAKPGGDSAGPDAASLDDLAAAPRAERPREPVPAALLAVPAERIVDVDVREDLRAGREPFKRIMDAARELPRDGVMRLRAIFEPAPLYAVLGKQGFAHFTESFSDDDWRVWFYRGERTSAPSGAEQQPPEAPAHAPEEGLVVLDVRDLEPPEPMVRTLEALASLPRGSTLVQLNVRVPQFLLPKLEERGFVYEVREQSPELVRLFIRHKS